MADTETTANVSVSLLNDATRGAEDLALAQGRLYA